MIILGMYKNHKTIILNDPSAIFSFPGDTIPAIWDTVTDRIIVGLDPEIAGSKKSWGPTGTHYLMRTLNSLYNEQLPKRRQIDTTEDDRLNNCIDFDIYLKDSKAIATLPNSVATSIPGVIGMDVARADESWLDIMSLYDVQCFCRDKLIYLFKSLTKIANAASVSDLEFFQDFFKAIPSGDSIKLAAVIGLSFERKVTKYALSHQDTIDFGQFDEIISYGEVTMKIDFTGQPHLIVLEEN